MKYLVLLTPAAGKTAGDFGPHKIAEVNSVWAAYNSGALREFYASPSPTAVTLIYEVPDRAALSLELEKLPMIRAGLLDRQIVQLGPFLQLAALFDKSLADAS
jgi:hypothetical protein